MSEVVTTLRAVDNLTDVTESAIQSVEAYAQKTAALLDKAAKAWLAFVTAGVGATAHLARQAEQGERRLQATLEATGHAAGFTRDQLADYALQLQHLTGIMQGTTVDAMTMLTTFDKVAGPVFLRAIRLAQDLASAGFGNLEGNAVMLGKALQDPIQGMSALTRVGVSLSQAQQQAVRDFAEMGDTARAQGIILEAVAGQVGGVAEKTRDAMGAIKASLVSLGEAIGAVYLGPMQDFMETVNFVIIATQKWVEANADAILSFTKWSVAIAGAIVIVPKLVAAIKAVIAAYKAMAAAKTVVLALAGPKGWAILLGAAAASAVALGAVSHAFDGIAGSAEAAMQDAKAAMEEMRADARKARDEMERDAKAGPQKIETTVKHDLEIAFDAAMGEYFAAQTEQDQEFIKQHIAAIRDAHRQQQPAFAGLEEFSRRLAMESLKPREIDQEKLERKLAEEARGIEKAIADGRRTTQELLSPLEAIERNTRAGGRAPARFGA